MIWGSVLAVIAVLWLLTRPGLNTKASFTGGRHRQVQDAEPSKQAAYPQNNIATRAIREAHTPLPLPNTEPSENGPAPTTADESKVPDLTVSEQDERIKTDRFHFVQKGETLSEISQQYYGSARKWQKIFDANREVIKNPRILKSGTKLIIPE